MFQFQNKTISGLLIVSLMLFSFAPQTAYAGGVVNAVVDVVSSVVETVVDVVVDVVKEVMSNPVLGIIVAVAVAYATGYSWGIESGFIEELGVEHLLLILDMAQQCPLLKPLLLMRLPKM